MPAVPRRLPRLLLLLLLTSLPTGTGGQSWGLNVHFVSQDQPGEIAQVAAAATIARADLLWAPTERVPGQYLWAPYDQLMRRLGAHGLRPYLTIDYSNVGAFPVCNRSAPHANGPDHVGPASPACVAAFVRFATAAMRHLHGVCQQAGTAPPIFELWNEPNTVFWGSPTGNATEYATLARALRRAMDAANLSAMLTGITLLGPALAGFGLAEGWEFLAELERSGTLALFDAVSVHPYRVGGPESVLQDYARLRQLRGVKSVVSGEWGWSTCSWAPPLPRGSNCPPQARATEEDEARWLARSWLLNAMAGVAHSIFYDYVDDCEDDRNRECRFGIVRHGYNNESMPHEPKPAFYAAAALQRLLGNSSFVQRMAAAPAEQRGKVAAKADVHSSPSVASLFVALYEGGTIAAWTNSSGAGVTAVVRPEMAEVTTGVATGPPPSPSCWQRFEMDGTMTDRVCMAANGELALPLTRSPSYFVQLPSTAQDDKRLKTDDVGRGERPRRAQAGGCAAGACIDRGA
jgi:hypothetical protein